jgi:hypothetical protein
MTFQLSIYWKVPNGSDIVHMYNALSRQSEEFAVVHRVLNARKYDIAKVLIAASYPVSPLDNI